MNLQTVRQNLTAVVENVNALRVYDTVPTQISPPAAVVILGDGTYSNDFDAAMLVNYTVLILLTRADDRHGQERLDEFLSIGNDSIYHQLGHDPTLGGACDSARVVGWNQPATFSIAGIDYIGVEVTVEVLG